MTSPGPVVLHLYTDLLCVWAYVSEVRFDEVRSHFGDQVAIRERFCSVFADVPSKLGNAWQDRGGMAGYREHVRATVARFDHVALHADTWTRSIPNTSATLHAIVKAAEIAYGADPAEGARRARALTHRLRHAFYAEGRDVGRFAIQLELAEELGLDPDALRAPLDDGSAWAALHRDHAAAAADGVRGSPTLMLNDQRQMLYGNVGYKIIEANIQEVLRDGGDRASWC